MNTLAIFKKEMHGYFVSPIAYVVLGIFILLSGYFFQALLAYFHLVSMQSALNPGLAGSLNPTEGILRPLFRNLSVILLLLLPAVSMRLFAEERKSGTIELLFTYPIRDGELLLGKFCAAAALYTLMLLLTVSAPIMLAFFVPLEWGAVASGYLGLLLLGLAFLALGTLISAVTKNQIVAAIGAFGALLLFWVIGWSADSAGGTFGTVLTHLSIINHYESFSKGVIETKDLIYYLDFTVFFLFLTWRVLDSKLWRI